MADSFKILIRGFLFTRYSFVSSAGLRTHHRTLHSHDRKLHHVRWYSNGRRPNTSGGGFLQKFIENLRKNLDKDKKMQENLKAFESERSQIVQSDSVKLLRQKASDAKEWSVTLLLRAIDTSRWGFNKLRGTSREAFEQASKTELGKKGQKVGAQVVETASKTAEKISKQAEELGKTDVYKTVSKGAETVKEELLDDIIKESAPYQAPSEILKRSDRATLYDGSDPKTQRHTIKPDDDTKTVVLTRRSKLKEKWRRWKESNPVSNMIYTMRMHYDESDNLVVRGARTVTDKIGDSFSGMATQSDMAETLGEIHKVDPSFDKERFIKECQFEIIPTVLEAYLQGRIDILKDWCHEAAYNVLSALIKQRSSDSKSNTTKVLEVRNVDVLGAKLLEQGPVMILTFSAQQVTHSTNNSQDELLENVFYVWALCRDQSIYDPRTAWRILEFGVQASGKLLL